MDFGGRVDIMTDDASIEGMIGGLIALIVFFVVVPILVYVWNTYFD